MIWQEIRDLCPHQWVLIEAVGAYPEGPKRVVNEVQLAGRFGDDSRAAHDRYTVLHAADRERESYSVHTDREELNIGIFDGRFNRIVT